LRGAESAKDVEFVRGLTTKFNFEFVFQIQNPKSKIQNQIGNLEQNARIARYQFLNETAENLHAFGILTAHTLNDQAETFLLNLIRGSGLDGLGGMKPIRSQESRVESRESDEKSQIPNPKSQIRLVRPLLNWARREDTENFCRLNEVEFCSDPMNEDLAFKRVRIRKVLLPMLQDFNPKIIETLANTASLLREDAEFLLAATQEVGSRQSAVGSFSDNEGQRTKDKGQSTLSLKDLKNLFPSMRRQILREWLKDERGDLRTLEAKHFAAIERLIFSRKSGKTVELPNGESVVKKEGKLEFQNK
jgi:tRNA(Ile)-lysidine synthase